MSYNIVDISYKEIKNERPQIIKPSSWSHYDGLAKIPSGAVRYYTGSRGFKVQVDDAGELVIVNPPVVQAKANVNILTGDE